MTKIQYLRKTKRFLLNVARHRQFLLDTKKSRKPATDLMLEIIKLITYWVPQIQSFDRIVKFINRPKIKNGVHLLIPAKNEKWVLTFNQLLAEAEELQQPANQLELTYSC